MKRQSRPLIARIIAFLIGGSLGVYTVLLTRSAGPGASGQRVLILMLLLGMLFVFNAPVVILHELGHFIGGLLCRQRLFYLSFGPMHIVRRADGKLHPGWRRNPGVAGQCSMYSPTGDILPLPLFLGGPAANLLTGALFAFGAWQTRPIVLEFDLLHTSLLLLALLSLLHGVTNLIPRVMLSGATDGYQFRLLKTDAAARADYARLLQITRALQQETRLKDMPEEWFTLPPLEQLTSLYAQVMAQNCIARLVDRDEFSAALELSHALLQAELPFPPGIRMHLVQDGALCEMLLSQPGECLRLLQEKGMLNLRRMHKEHLCVQRTDYAAALLLNRDSQRAAAIRATFDRIAARYPFAVDAAAEKDLMTRIEQTAASLPAKEA